MAISLYDLSVNSYLQILGGVTNCLEKGLVHFRKSGLDPEQIAVSCLHPDMNSFDFQIQAITHHSIGALNAVKEGVYVPKPKVPPVGYRGLQQMVIDAQSALQQLSPAEIDGHGGGEVVFRFGDITLPFTTENFLLSFALPNFYFHAVTAYDILRMKGVPIGKVDYMAQMRIKR